MCMISELRTLTGNNKLKLSTDKHEKRTFRWVVSPSAVHLHFNEWMNIKLRLDIRLEQSACLVRIIVYGTNVFVTTTAYCDISHVFFCFHSKSLQFQFLMHLESKLKWARIYRVQCMLCTPLSKQPIYMINGFDMVDKGLPLRNNSPVPSMFQHILKAVPYNKTNPLIIPTMYIKNANTLIQCIILSWEC